MGVGWMTYALRSMVLCEFPNIGLVIKRLNTWVPRPTHASKSQHRGKVPTFEPHETIQIWLISIKVGC